jgi:hypothetical protein
MAGTEKTRIGMNPRIFLMSISEDIKVCERNGVMGSVSRPCVLGQPLLVAQEAPVLQLVYLSSDPSTATRPIARIRKRQKATVLEALNRKSSMGQLLLYIFHFGTFAVSNAASTCLFMSSSRRIAKISQAGWILAWANCFNIRSTPTCPC